MILDYALGGPRDRRAPRLPHLRAAAARAVLKEHGHDPQRLDPDPALLRDRRRAREAARRLHDARLQRRAHIALARPAAGRAVLYGLAGVDEREEQHWLDLCGRHAALQRRRASSCSMPCSACRASCRSTRRSMAAVAPDLAFNTAISFVTNTNWQNYGGESTMSLSRRRWPA